MNATRFRAPVAAALLSLAALAPANAARIVLNNVDPPGVGFNDRTRATPEGGNAGKTVGAQRLIAYRKALELWGKTLKSDVKIIVRGSFARLDCDASGGVLAQAGALQIFSDFPNAPLAGTWYGAALANAIAGQDLAPGGPDQPGTDDANDDIIASFNGAVGEADCIAGPGWYYGLDNKPTDGRIDFLNVFMHEVAHGLGFQNFLDVTSGETILGQPDVYMAHTRDLTISKQWNQMTADELVASATRNGQVVWAGDRVTRNARKVLGPYQGVRLGGALTNELEYGPAGFGAEPTTANFGGAIALADDGAGLSPSDACEPIANASFIAGKVALADRGNCTFVVKAQNLQAAGAKAIILANNNGGASFSPGGSDASITIPVIGISAADGAAIKAALPTVTIAFFTDPRRRAGASQGYVRLYAPPVVSPGSSISHFDTAATPSVLMEPFITDALVASRNTDLTPSLMSDIGWQLETLKIGRCDTGVESALANGQLLHANASACQAQARRRGDYTACMVEVTSHAYLERLLSRSDATSIFRCLVRNLIGH